MNPRRMITLLAVLMVAGVGLAQAQGTGDTPEFDITTATTAIVDGRTVYHTWMTPDEGEHFTSLRWIDAELWVASASEDPVYGFLTMQVSPRGCIAGAFMRDDPVEYIGYYPHEGLHIYSYSASLYIACHNWPRNPFKPCGIEEGQAFGADIIAQYSNQDVASRYIGITQFRCSHDGEQEMQNLPPNGDEDKAAAAEEQRSLGSVKSLFR